MANVRAWVLRDYMSEQPLHPTDMLVELSTVTFDSATTVTVPTKFTDGNIIAVLIGKITSSAIYYMHSKTVTAGTITITADSSSSESVDIAVIGRITI